MTDLLTRAALADPDPVTEDDLLAYVDGQLDPRREAAVADVLAGNPAAAARIFADIHARRSLKAAFADMPVPGSPRLRAAAHRLQTRLWLRRAGRMAGRAAAVIALIAVGWYAHWQAGAFDIADSDETPAFVVDAVHAYRVSLQRAQARSENVEEVFARSQVAMPHLKKGWRLADALIYPSAGGDGVEATLSAGDAGELSLFALRTDQPHSINPTVTRTQDQTTVYWQRGSTFYALTGRRPANVMRSIADTLMKG